MSACRVFSGRTSSECGRPSVEHCSLDPTPDHRRGCLLAHHPYSAGTGRPRFARGGAGSALARSLKANPSFAVVALTPCANEWILWLALAISAIAAAVSFYFVFSDHLRSARERREAAFRRRFGTERGLHVLVAAALLLLATASPAIAMPQPCERSLDGPSCESEPVCSGEVVLARQTSSLHDDCREFVEEYGYDECGNLVSYDSWWTTWCEVVSAPVQPKAVIR